jgi:ubiquinone/menaquinone biosynthesis C-methylase UbiE
LLASTNQQQRKLIFSWKDYKEFFSYARRRIRSEQDYFSFEKYQGTLLVRYLKSKGVPIDQSHALDIGCGFGGYATALQEAGSKAIGLDLNSMRISRLPEKVAGDALCMPFPAERFTMVICSSLIEHIPDPLQLLLEVDRILKPKGYLYLSFPPFYSPAGGHQFAPFHYFGEKLAISIFTRRKKFAKQEWIKRYLSFSPSSYSSSFGSWGLYRRTISWAKKEIKKFSWDVIDCSTRFSPLNTTLIPVLGEFLTWHIQFLIRKNENLHFDYTLF